MRQGYLQAAVGGDVALEWVPLIAQARQGRPGAVVPRKGQDGEGVT